MRKTTLVNSAFADAEPVPITFAKGMTKSLIFGLLINITECRIGRSYSINDSRDIRKQLTREVVVVIQHEYYENAIIRKPH